MTDRGKGVVKYFSKNLAIVTVRGCTLPAVAAVPPWHLGVDRAGLREPERYVLARSTHGGQVGEAEVKTDHTYLCFSDKCLNLFANFTTIIIRIWTFSRRFREILKYLSLKTGQNKSSGALIKICN